MENLKYTDILKLNKELASKIMSTPYEIGILSNVTINPLKEVLEYSCRIEQIEPNIEIGNFDNIVQDSIVFNKKKLVIIFYETLNIVDQLNGFFEDLDDETLNHLKQRLFSEFNIIFENLKTTPSVIFNLFSDAYFQFGLQQQTRVSVFVKDLNDYLSANAPSNFKLKSIDQIYKLLGFKQCFDQRFYLSSKAPYTVNFFREYSSSIQNELIKNNGKIKKAIVFDCDNTLWKGIIGEDGIDGIDMSSDSKQGSVYRRIQQIAVFLSKKGVIIGLCSKNNETDVLDVIRTHKDIVLKEENIVIYKINWSDKASNLRQIAGDLNIGIDSLIFVDDSSFEINLIKAQIPEILCIQVPKVISEFPALLLENAFKYFNLSVNSDDLKKTEMYKKDFLRESTKSSFSSIEGYLASLEIEIHISENDPAYIPRVAQLTQKTNQFNLTTKRYTETEIKSFVDSGRSIVYALFVRDKFGDSGLTGACILIENENNPSEVKIDTLLMSCRIIGRNIEYSFVGYVIKNIIGKGYKNILASYCLTKKNAQVATFYEGLGFQNTEVSIDSKLYHLNPANYSSPNFDYITINHQTT
jgi:FkbH-like protein